MLKFKLKVFTSNQKQLLKKNSKLWSIGKLNVVFNGKLR